jgi:ankyrin repeat protein
LKILIKYFKQLFRHGLNPNFTEPKTPTITLSSNPSLFLLACQNSSAPVIKLFLSFEELDVGYEDANGENALFYAVRNRSVEESKEIIHLILTDFPYLVKLLSIFRFIV